MNKFHKLLCLVLMIVNSHAVYGQRDAIEMNVTLQPSSLVRVRLLRDRYTGATGQEYTTKITNLTDHKLRVIGTLTAVTVCGTEDNAKFNVVISPGVTMGGKAFLSDDLGMTGSVFEEKCRTPEKFSDPNNPVIIHLNRIRSVSIRDFSVTTYQEDDNVSGNSRTEANSAYQNNSNSQASSNDITNRQNQAQRQTNQAAENRQRQLAFLNEASQRQAAKYDAVESDVSTLLNLFVNSMMQNNINKEKIQRNVRFEHLQEKVNTGIGTLVDCGQCNGQGYTMCSSCNGRGYNNCNVCNGTGKTRCTFCSGTGTAFGRTCSICGGKGYTKCSYCFGNGKNICVHCYGLGNLQCVYCQGTGKEFKEN